MTDVEIYYKFKEATDSPKLEINVLEDDLLDNSDKLDLSKINHMWKRLKLEVGNKIFYRPRGLGSLYNTKNGKSEYVTTDFRTYVVTSRSYETKPLSEFLYKHMRVSSIGCAVMTNENGIFVEGPR